MYVNVNTQKSVFVVVELSTLLLLKSQGLKIRPVTIIVRTEFFHSLSIVSQAVSHWFYAMKPGVNSFEWHPSSWLSHWQFLKVSNYWYHQQCVATCQKYGNRHTCRLLLTEKQKNSGSYYLKFIVFSPSWSAFRCWEGK